MSFYDEIVNVIRQCLPGDAHVRVINGTGEFRVGVSWKLNNDPQRPNKMSKTISIIVSSEATQDFTSASSSNQTDAYERIARFLQQKLANFEPDHNVSAYDPPPVEEWVINSNVIFG